MQNFDGFTFKMAIAALTLFVADVFGGISGLLAALLIFMLVDIVTGFLAAVINKQLSAAVMFKGGCKKFVIMAVIVLVHYLGDSMNVPWLREAVISYYLIGEALSVLENAVKSGVKIPAFLIELLQKAGELTEAGKPITSTTQTTIEPVLIPVEPEKGGMDNG
jgi:toxin secretion/phage lysis holin